MLNFIKIILKNLFNIKDKNYYSPLQYEIEYEKKSLPPWDEIIEMCYDKQLGGYDDAIEKVIYSKSKDFRAIILRTSTNIYTVSYEKLYPWDEEDKYEMSEYWSGGLPGYWGGFSTSAIGTKSFYDSLKTAEREIFSIPEFRSEIYG